MKKGFSLIEMLIVVTVFSILAVLVAQTIAHSLRSSKRSEATGRVRENLDYALTIIGLNLRNSEGATCTTEELIDYTDVYGNLSSFECLGVGAPDGYIASGSGRLTSGEVSIEACSFTCDPGTGGMPDAVNITLIGVDEESTGIESARVEVQTKILLRNY